MYEFIATQPNTLGKCHIGGKYGENIFPRVIERQIKFSCFYDSKLWFNYKYVSIKK